MILFTEEDRPRLRHIVDVVTDWMLEDDEYTAQDQATVDKLDQLLAQLAAAQTVTCDSVLTSRAEL